MLKLKSISEPENSVAVLIPADVLENFGISAGDDIDLTQTENALVLRSVDQSKRSREIADATEKVFDRWNNVFVELAKGADEE